MSKYPHPIFRHYLEGEDDKPYYTMNSLAFYYEDMERKQKLIESLAKSIAGYDIRLTENLESIEQEVDKRLADWDKQLETFPESVEDLLTKWTTDGTIDQVIQTALIDEKIAPVTAQLAEKALEKYVNQEDYVETLKRHTNPINMIVTPNNVNEKNVNIIYQLSDERAVQYNIAKNQFDDYIMLLAGRVGVLQYNQGESGKSNWDSRTGQWVDTVDGGSSYYALPGATMRKQFYGSAIALNFYGDTRGGYWNVVVDGDTENPVKVSVYRATAGQFSHIFFTETANENHEIVATFMGDDPENPPSNGAGNSRGWANFATATPTYTPTFTIYRTYITTTNVAEPLFGASNKPFAFSIRKAGTANPYYFVPWHTQPTAFKVTEPKMLVDGKEILLTNLESISEVKEFKLVQKIYAKVPETPENLLIISEEVTFSADGTVHIDGKATVLSPVDMDWGYGVMTPVNKSFAQKMLSSLHNSFTAKSDGSNEYLTEEIDRATSYLFLNDTMKSIGLATRINNPKLSLRQGKTDKAPANQVTFWQHRTTGMNKLYNVAYKNAALQTGDSFRFSGTYIIAQFDGLYDLF